VVVVEKVYDTGDPGSTDRAAGIVALYARIDDPHIRRPLSWRLDASGYIIVTSEYVDGTSLASLLREARSLDFGYCLALLKGIAVGLLALHSRGLFHGGLKPSNILLDAEGRVRISISSACVAVEGELLFANRGTRPSTEELLLWSDEISGARGIPQCVIPPPGTSEEATRQCLLQWFVMNWKRIEPYIKNAAYA
jgi:serine/threonine protein kinase